MKGKGCIRTDITYKWYPKVQGDRKALVVPAGTKPREGEGHAVNEKVRAI